MIYRIILPPPEPPRDRKDDIHAAEVAIAVLALKAAYFFAGAATALLVVALARLIGG